MFFNTQRLCDIIHIYTFVRIEKFATTTCSIIYLSCCNFKCLPYVFFLICILCGYICYELLKMKVNLTFTCIKLLILNTLFQCLLK